MVKIMVADVLATQGARASATRIFTMMNRKQSVPARQGLSLILGPIFLGAFQLFIIIEIWWHRIIEYHIHIRQGILKAAMTYLKNENGSTDQTFATAKSKYRWQ